MHNFLWYIPTQTFFFNKIGELQALITGEKNYIIAVTEVFPKSQQLDYNGPELQLDGYTIFHPTKKVFTDRGCIIYIKGTLTAYQIESQETEFIEFIQTGIKTQSGSNILISCIYRSPSANNDDCVRELSDIISIKKFCNTKFDCILHMGDFNFKELNWVDQNTSVGTVHISSKFLEVVRQSFLFQQCETTN